MAARFWAAGSAVAGVLTTLDLVVPTCNVGDFIFAQIASNDNTAPTAPTGYVSIAGVNNGTGLRASLWVKAAVAGDSGATHQWTGFAGTTVNFGILTVYRGCFGIGSASASANASADAVTYATITPKRNDSIILAFGYYQDDLTTAGSITSTAPSSFANVVDVETATGNDLSLFQYWGNNNVGGATGALSHTTTSTVDAVNVGVLVEITSETGAGGLGNSGEQAVYPRFPRVRPRL